MSVIRSVKDRYNPYVQINRKVFDDPNLSLKAKGFIGYCLSKPDHWQFHVDQLASVLKEGKKCVYATIQECIKNGYAFRYQPRKPNGDMDHWVTIISDSKEEIQKILTETGLAEAQVAEAQKEQLVINDCSVKNEAKVITKTTETFSASEPVVKESVVACGAVVVFEKEGKVAIAKKEPILEDDVFYYANKTGKDWNAEEIECAFRVYKASKYNVSDPIAYIEGIINKKRILQQNKERKCKNQTSKNSQSFSKKTLTKKNTNEVSNLKSSSETLKKDCSENATEEPPAQTYSLEDAWRKLQNSCEKKKDS